VYAAVVSLAIGWQLSVGLIDAAVYLAALTALLASPNLTGWEAHHTLKAQKLIGRDPSLLIAKLRVEFKLSPELGARPAASLQMDSTQSSECGTITGICM
jgi:phage-related baseplate assembly protein